MNHYGTYFDRGFAIQGLALWRSLAAHDSADVLWVLALDLFAREGLTHFVDQEAGTRQRCKVALQWAMNMRCDKASALF